ncbi:hypothetical protein BDK51DRAFT_48330 [Blyttiomyces helicus]|uniref:Uncharacterized protein n=1 Tax=Blyttiomyces helicus TaxID=388810 RepID=A0A4P9VZP8_9FUNG|nr:hypothetical protein BDK51DRAFT_48330 [Blyttiomyces helicus]|eukprot:RKO84822.1 hypothetical protein BDK51DRAFT_48330 [Blyttiomyces helicus]
MGDVPLDVLKIFGCVECRTSEQQDRASAPPLETVSRLGGTHRVAALLLAEIAPLSDDERVVPTLLDGEIAHLSPDESEIALEPKAGVPTQNEALHHSLASAEVATSAELAEVVVQRDMLQASLLASEEEKKLLEAQIETLEQGAAARMNAEENERAIDDDVCEPRKLVLAQPSQVDELKRAHTEEAQALLDELAAFKAEKEDNLAVLSTLAAKIDELEAQPVDNSAESRVGLAALAAKHKEASADLKLMVEQRTLEILAEAKKES